MDLSEFDPFHPSPKPTPPPSRLFVTPPLPKSNNLSSFTATLPLPPNSTSLPVIPVTQDPLEAFNLLSFDNETPGLLPPVIPAIVAVQNARKESTLRDLEKGPWNGLIDAPPSYSDTALRNTLLESGRGTVPVEIAGSSAGRRHQPQTQRTGSGSSGFSPPKGLMGLMGEPSLIASGSSRIDIRPKISPRRSTTTASTSPPQTVMFDPFPPDLPSKSPPLHLGGYLGDNLNGGRKGSEEEEDWWSGFQSATAIAPALAPRVASTLPAKESVRSQASNKSIRMERTFSDVSSKGKGKERDLAVEGGRDWKNSFLYDVNGADAIQPIQLLGVKKGAKRALNEDIAEGIRPGLPPRLRLSTKWNLLYSLDQHGTSFETMYETMQLGMKGSEQGVVLVVKDESGSVFGAFVNQVLMESQHYYGDGTCFLWKSSPFEPNDFRVGSSVKMFRWSGKNDYLILTDSKFISVGGGNGKFGLWIDSNFNLGHTATCPCFDNEPLTEEWGRGIVDGEEAGFKVVMFEIWAPNL